MWRQQDRVTHAHTYIGFVVGGRKILPSVHMPQVACVAHVCEAAAKRGHNGTRISVSHVSMELVEVQVLIAVLWLENGVWWGDAGTAGHHAFKQLRRLDKTGSVLIIGQEEHAPYTRECGCSHPSFLISCGCSPLSVGSVGVWLNLCGECLFRSPLVQGTVGGGGR